MESLSCFSFKGDVLEMHALASNFSLPCMLERRRRKKGWEAGNGVCRGSHGFFFVYSSSSLGSYRMKGVGQHSLRFAFECQLFDVFLKPIHSGRACSEKLSSTCNVLVGLVSGLRHETAGGDDRQGELESENVFYEISDSKVSGIEEANNRQTNDLDEEGTGFVKNDKDGRESNEDNSPRVDVRALAWSLRFAKSADEVGEVVKDRKEVPLRVFSSMIRGFGAEKNLDPAFAIVEWLKKKKLATNGETGPNLFIYNSLLGAVKQSKQLGLVDKIMEDMDADGVAPNIVTYNILMSIYLEQEEPEKALNIFLKIPDKGVMPSPVSYSTVLLAYRRMEDGQGALDFFIETLEKYQKGDIGKDRKEDWENEIVQLEKFTIRICYQVMRRWLVQGDLFTTKILRLLGEMDKARLQPGQSDYEKLIWACTIEGHYAVARELYRRIREQESEVNLSVCNHLIWLMGKAKKWWAALEIYEDLLDKGPQPNNLSCELILSHFNVLLTAAKKRGIWKWGVRLLNKLQDKGLKPGSREWNAVLVACSKASETAAAVQIFRRMVEQGEKPTVISYGALLSALEKGKLYDEALKVWEHMCKVGVEPNIYAYTILISVYIGRGQYDLVDSVIREMTSRGVEPTVVTFNAIITGCTKKGEGGTAFEWFNRMKLQNITPNEITYEMLIEALAKDGKPRLAYEIYVRAQKEGLQLSCRVYDSVLLSARSYGASIDANALGPRPLEKKKVVKTRKILSEFCDSAGVPRRVQPFDRKEIYPSQTEENVD